MKGNETKGKRIPTRDDSLIQKFVKFATCLVCESIYFSYHRPFVLLDRIVTLLLLISICPVCNQSADARKPMKANPLFEPELSKQSAGARKPMKANPLSAPKLSNQSASALVLNSPSWF